MSQPAQQRLQLSATLDRLRADADRWAQRASDIAAQAGDASKDRDEAKRLMLSASEFAGRAAALRYAIGMLEQHT
jgi:hypothetical protein